MGKADIVFTLIARQVGMEHQAEQLRALMDLYLDAVAEDLDDVTADAEELDISSPLPDVAVEAVPEAPPPYYAPAPPLPEEEPAPEEVLVVPEEATPPVEKNTAREPTPEHGYIGFLHLRCPQCGEIKTFCAKQPLRRYRCGACGTETGLEGLTTAWTDCECGERSKYRTNRTEWGFDIPCVSCGAPVAMEYRAGKNVYATIGKQTAKGKKRR